MVVAIVGSRGLCVTDLEKYLPEGVTEIVSGGAKGIDCLSLIHISEPTRH